MRTPNRKSNAVALLIAIVHATGFSALAAAASPKIVSFDSGSRDRSTAIATDTLGNRVIAGQVGDAFGVLKFDSHGSLLWSYRFQEVPAWIANIADSVAVDGAGNIYAAGRVLNSTNGSDWLTVKLASDGQQLWSRKILGSVGSNARAMKIAADRFGNVFVGGQLDGNAVMAKYTANGALLWQRTLLPGSISSDFVALAADASGDLVAIVSSPDVVTIKLDPQGASLWQATFGESQRTFFPRALAITQAGNIWVTGFAITDEDVPAPPFTLIYDANGNAQRVIREGGTSMALDFADNVLLANTVEAAAMNDRRPSVAKFDSQGNKVWETIISNDSAADTFSNLGTRVVTDAAGSVFVAGNIDTNGTNAIDYLVANLDSNGAVLWLHRFNGAAGMTDSVRDMALDIFGNAVVTGYSYDGCSPMPACDSINTLMFAQGVPPEPTSTLPPAPPPSTAPNAPSNLSATVTSTSTTLRWLDNANNESGFAIERCAGKNCSFSQIATVSANVITFTNAGLAANTSYSYRVRAFNSIGNSAYSNAITAKTAKR